MGVISDADFEVLFLLFHGNLTRTDIPQLAVDLGRDPHGIKPTLMRLESLGLITTGSGYWCANLTDEGRWMVAEADWRARQMSEEA